MIFTKSIPVIVDIGGYNIKGGFSGDEAPRSIFPSCIGLPKNKAIIVGPNTKECFIGNEAINKKGVLNMHYPIENGNIKEWSHLEKILHNSFFSELLVDISKFPLMLISNPNLSEDNIKQLTEIIFENFNVPSFYWGLSNVLSLFSIGKNNGLVLDSGHSTTNGLGIFEGYPVIDDLKTMNNISGQSLTNRIIKEFEKDNIKIDFYTANYIKENYLYLNEETNEETGEIILPDGNTINLTKNILSLPYDEFFNQEINKLEDCLFDVLENSDEFIVNDLVNNIYITGGNTMFNNFNYLLEKRLNEKIYKSSRRAIYLKDKRKVTINTQNDQIFSPWIGGSILSSLSTFESIWITKKEYEEYGNEIVLRKCLI